MSNPVLKKLAYLPSSSSVRCLTKCSVHLDKSEIKQKEKVKSFKEIPGPKPLPIIGNIWRYIPLIGEYSFKRIQKSYQKMHQQYGPIVQERLLGSQVIVHVFDPDDMMKVYRNEGQYPQRRSHRALAKYRKERPHIYKNSGLFPSNGEEWYRFRKLFQKVFMHPTVVQTFYDDLEDVTNEFVAKIPKILDRNNEVDLQPELFKYALECVGAIALNRRLGCLSFEKNDEIQNLVKAAHDTHYSVFITEQSPFYNYFKTPSYRRLVSAQDYFASVVDKYMKEAELKASDPKSLLHKMLQIPDADYKDVFTMVLDMFLAGIDTTAYTTAFALYNLCKHPDVQTKLREELIQKYPQKSSNMSETLEKLPYLNGVIRESLRINPVSLGNGRVLVEDLILSNYMVPAGTPVVLQHQAASFDESNFQEPLAFRPERWITSGGDRREHHPFASAPFGAGPRSCLGRRFALREMMFALGKIIRNFEVSYHYDDINTIMRLINVPDKPLNLRFRKIQL